MEHFEPRLPDETVRPEEFVPEEFAPAPKELLPDEAASAVRAQSASDGDAPKESPGASEGVGNERLFVIGGKVQDGVPGPSRPTNDYDVESLDDVVGPYSPTSPQDEIPGRSMFIAPEYFLDRKMDGRIFEFKGPLPQGTAIHADGSDVGGWTHEGHRTMYPTEATTLAELDEKVLQAQLWEYWGQVDRKGRLRPKDE